ncbi:CLUMA_CG014581, isoform A [Clunio marinus]|uniref:CLUMA_CG014581, isoform A n=1 Tax=Clunio marinus TaxID=568069 RepID=A0A1J1IMC4_9DIPT|nr:CLUMA_CG014581, isoform A [Clunio marinus]
MPRRQNILDEIVDDISTSRYCELKDKTEKSSRKNKSFYTMSHIFQDHHHWQPKDAFPKLQREKHKQMFGFEKMRKSHCPHTTLQKIQRKH